MRSGTSALRFWLLLFVVAILQVAHWSGAFTVVDDAITGARMKASARSASGSIAFLAIDRESLDAIGVWPWPREVHARVVDALVQQGASDIFFDVDFSTPSDPANDAAFLAALERAGGSVLLPSFGQSGTASGDAQTVTRPLPAFADTSWPVGVNVVPERDGIVRRLPTRIVLNEELVPSAPAVLAGREDRSEDIRVDFSIDPRTIPTHSLSDLLGGRIPSGTFTDRKVVIGAHALELRDNFAVPVHRTVSGPVLQILGAETLLLDRALDGPGWPGALALGFVLLCGLFAAWRGGRLSVRLAILGSVAAGTEIVALWLQIDRAVVLPTTAFHCTIAAAGIATLMSDLGVKRFLLKLARRETRTTRALLERVFADTADGVLICDRDGRVLERNDTLRRMMQSAASPLGRSAVLRPDIRAIVARVAAGSGVERGDIALCDDLVVQYVARRSRLDAEDGSDPFEFVALNLRDVTELKRREDMLAHLSRHDDLTGALQRHAFVEALRQAQDDLRVVVADARNLAGINANLGWDAGDRILREVCDRFGRVPTVRIGPARLSGGTFAIAIDPDHGAKDLAAMVETPVSIDGSKIPVTFRWGLSALDDAPIDTRLEQAEAALDAAKTVRVEKFVTFAAADGARARRRHRLERDMQTSLQEGRFWVAYQLQVDARDGSPCGAEALVRWDHPEFGFVSPAEFIEIAEASGFIDDLGAFVLRQACRDAAEWPDDLSVAVNVSAGQLNRNVVLGAVQDALRLSGLDPARLELELTESSFIDGADALLEQLERIRELGISLALDDFGTGFSSLGYLTRFPLSKIKLDQMFVRDVTTTPGALAIVRSTQALAEGLGIKMLCEGVEMASDWHAIRDIGAAEIQGYFFAKPVDAKKFKSSLAKAVELEAVA